MPPKGSGKGKPTFVDLSEKKVAGVGVVSDVIHGSPDVVEVVSAGVVGKGQPEVVVPVTPEKAVVDGSKDHGNVYEEEDPDKVFAVVNRDTFAHSFYKTKPEAMKYLKWIHEFTNASTEHLIVMGFGNMTEAKEHIKSAQELLNKQAEPAQAHTPPPIKTIAEFEAASSPFRFVARRGPAIPSATQASVAHAPVAHESPAGAAVASPNKRLKMSFAKDSTPAATSPFMVKYKEKLQKKTSKLAVFHMVLPSSEYDVWGMALKEKDDYYWSWKPTILDLAIETEAEMPLFEEEHTNLDDFLLNVRSCHIRETPCGPNIQASMTLGKTGRQLYFSVLYGTVNPPSTEASVVNDAQTFVERCQNKKVQLAYSHAVESVMKADNIKNDVAEGGQLWRKLLAAAENVEYTKLHCLSQVFLDDKIDDIICKLYSKDCSGKAYSMWPKAQQVLAYGEGGKM